MAATRGRGRAADVAGEAAGDEVDLQGLGGQGGPARAHGELQAPGEGVEPVDDGAEDLDELQGVAGRAHVELAEGLKLRGLLDAGGGDEERYGDVLMPADEWMKVDAGDFQAIEDGIEAKADSDSRRTE